DARQPRRPPPPALPDLWMTASEERRDAHRHHAGADVRHQHGPELGTPDLAAAEVLGQLVGQPLGQLLGAVGTGQVGDTDIDRFVAGSGEDQRLETVESLARRPYLLEVADLAVDDPEQRLDGQR